MIVPTMNDEEKTFEAVRVCHFLNDIMQGIKPAACEKFRKATKYPYILRFDYTDDRMNKWRILFILQNKWYKKKKLFRTMAYTTYEVPPKREKNYMNAGKGVLLYDPPAMSQYIKNSDNPDRKMVAVGDIVPHAINQFTERALKPEGKGNLEFHKKVEELILRWRHFDVSADIYGDKSSLKHIDEGICPYDLVMSDGGMLRGQIVDSFMVRLFTYVGKDDLYEDQQDRYDDMMRERAEWLRQGYFYNKTD